MRILKQFNTTYDLKPQIPLWFGINITYMKSSLKNNERVV